MGAGQKSWVQSRTTFAALARDEHAGPSSLLTTFFCYTDTIPDL